MVAAINARKISGQAERRRERNPVPSGPRSNRRGK